MAYLLLAVAQVVGVVLTLLGWPGILLQLAGLGTFAWLVGTATFQLVPLVVLSAIGIIGEVIYLLVGGSIDLGRRRRAGLYTIAAALPGALIGNFFLPLVGPLYGALFGALLGVGVSAVGRRDEQTGCATALRHAFAMGIRTAAGVVVAVFILLTLIR